MKNIFIITSAPIHYLLPQHDLYDSFDLVSQGKAFTPLSEHAEETLKNHHFNFDIHSIQTIFTAEKGQTLETAKLFIKIHHLKKIDIMPSPLFESVHFSMHQLIPKKIFMREPYEKIIPEVRKKFVSELYHNRLLEGFEEVKKRILKTKKELIKSRRPTLCISHGFFMRLMEIYFTDPQCFTSEKKLLEAFHPCKKPYEPLEGFVMKFHSKF